MGRGNEKADQIQIATSVLCVPLTMKDVDKREASMELAGMVVGDEEAARSGPWMVEHKGHCALACASSTLGGSDGVSCCGVDMILRNTTSFCAQDAKHRDSWPRDGRVTECLSYSIQQHGVDGPCMHRLKHICKGGVMMPRKVTSCAAFSFDYGPTISRWICDPDDPRPSLFLALPVGCMIEEVVLFEPEPICLGTSRLQLTTVSIFHVEGRQLHTVRAAPPGGHYEALHTLTVGNAHVRPVWTGKLQMSGRHAAAANLRVWAAAQRDEAAARLGLQTERVGGVLFGPGGEHAKLMFN